MAKRKPRAKLRPKTPARVKKAKRARRSERRRHPELVGLALATVGLFLTVVLWLGWEGGVLGEKIADALEAFVGAGSLAIPPLLVVIGGLMMARAPLVNLRPFRTGLVALAFGTMTFLGDERGGAVGLVLATAFGRLLGDTGTFFVAAFAVSAGVLLVTGASIGAP